VINESLQNAVLSSTSISDSSHRIRARTARRWLNKMGFIFGSSRKDIYLDGHEREDVVKYRNEIFLKSWQELSSQFVSFSENGSWEEPSDLQSDKKPVVLVTHDESTFNANDGSVAYG
jgi:hypothetical protein